MPIVKYALYKHITQTGVYKGASIIEISTWINKYFGLEFPSVVLEKILLKIGQEINTSEEIKLQIYKDMEKFTEYEITKDDWTFQNVYDMLRQD